jgi:hypothetical protein
MPTPLSKDKKKLEDEYRLYLSWQFSTVEFLGLPSLKENRPLSLEEIYVPMSLRWENGDNADRVFVPDALKRSKHLVVLGDPGSGKSTLVKVLTYSFGRTEPTPLARHFPETRVPVPIILRDYNVREWRAPEDMLASFVRKLGSEIGGEVTPEWLMLSLASGRGILLVDGLDEVGNVDDRRVLRDYVVRPLLARMPNSLAVMTSRAVGYEEVPFDDHKLRQLAVPVETRPDGRPEQPRLSVERCYVAPFNDEEIEQFISRWYVARERDESRRKIGWESLRRALQQNDRIRRLATNPSLLTIIALVHRVTAQLPSGRVRLYDKIVEAYLETIQNYRRLGQYPASLEQMKRWLARVGWEMQNQRSAQRDGELLVSQERVIGWLQEAISLDRESPEEEAHQFLEFIARRSGLLIQRGPEEFAFVHLTFQEYFAAWHLRGEVFNFKSLVKRCAERVSDHSWHETLLLLFELLAEFPQAGDSLVTRLAKHAMKSDARREGVAELFSLLLLDEESGISAPQQKQICEFALEAGSDNFNAAVAVNLRQLQRESPEKRVAPSRFDGLIRPWLDTRLLTAGPDELGEDFFVLATQFDSYLDGWLGKLERWVSERGGLSWRERHIASAMMFSGGHSAKVCEWGIRQLSLPAWVRIRLSLHSIAYLNLKALLPSQEQSPRHRLLAQLGAAYATTRSQAMRVACLGVFQTKSGTLTREPQPPKVLYDIKHQMWESWEAEYYDARRTAEQNVARFEALIEAETWSVLRTQFTYDLFADGLALNIPSVSNTLADAKNIGWGLAGAADARETSKVEDDMYLATKLWAARQSLYSPDATPENFEASLNKLSYLHRAEDDWTKLVAVSSLLMLGAGTPERCRERNGLLVKATQNPDEFTFPEEVRAIADTPEFHENVAEIVGQVFLHKPGQMWLLPELFDPTYPGSRLLLSKPREFYALAAEVLDPEGQTEMVKWRGSS